MISTSGGLGSGNGHSGILSVDELLGNRSESASSAGLSYAGAAAIGTGIRITQADCKKIGPGDFLGTLVMGVGFIVFTAGVIQEELAFEKTLERRDNPQPRMVYRVWGGLFAPPNGRYWSLQDPRTVPDYRNAAGLPAQNTGEFLTTGLLIDSKGTVVQPAQPLHGNDGGGIMEIFVPSPEVQIRVIRTEPLDPNL